MEHLSAVQAREHAALVADLHTLTREQWRSPSLCGEWVVEEVVAHLGAASLLGPVRWFRSMVEARFDADVHNQRRLEEFLGATSSVTLERFAGTGTIRLPFRDSPGGLGELIVHAEDIRRPLGLVHAPDPAGLAAVARFFATRDFAVNSRQQVKGLRLVASDASFRAGRGPVVEGPLLSLVMAMAGRPAVLPDLHGDGVPELRRRLGQASRGT